MFKPLAVLIFFLLLCSNTLAQVLPSEGRELNYRLVGFSFPQEKMVKYTLEIAEGHIMSNTVFSTRVVKIVHTLKNKIIAEVPAFGKDYTWRVVYINAKSHAVTNSPLHHFKTGSNISSNGEVYKLTVTKPAKRFKEAYVFLNNKPVLYDMAGNPIWFLPQLDGRNRTITDLKLSSSGTITFLADDEAYEVNYDGEVLWKAHKNEIVGIEGFHHELTRLNSGHYMLLSNETLPCSVQPDSSIRVISAGQAGNGRDDSKTVRLAFGSIVEYDGKGKVVWQWKSSKYYGESDLVNRSLAGVGVCTDIHPNSFFFNEKDKTILLSCKHIGRIIKIKYPSGEVLGNYGEIYKPNGKENGNGLFCMQHGIKATHDGSLLLFNNNACNLGSPPTVEKLFAPKVGNGIPKKIWEYHCSAEVKDLNGLPVPGRTAFSVGGNVMELGDGSLFVSTAAPDNRVFIIDIKKEILWSAQPERGDPQTNVWQTQDQYRASIIETRKALENLIWKSSEGNHLSPAK